MAYNYNMDWTNDKIIKFIQAVETYPILWDSKHKDYKNRCAKHEFTQKVAQRLRCDSTEVLRKWKIILAQYRRERKKVAESKSSASENSKSAEYKPKWFAYEHLGFFHGKPRPNVSIDSDDEINDPLMQDIHTVKVEQEFHREIPVENFNALKNSSKRRTADEDPRSSHASSIMDNADNVNKLMEAKKQDEDDIFAAAIAIKLRKIKDERTKILVQRDIDKLLYDAIIGTGNYST